MCCGADDVMEIYWQRTATGEEVLRQWNWLAVTMGRRRKGFSTLHPIMNHLTMTMHNVNQ
jgi:hypothetical protein